jgi:outer membrane lipoprotein-sorting protein
MKQSKMILTLTLSALVLSISAFAQTEDVAEIMKKSHLAYYYAADDGIAEVTMTITDKRGKERVKEFVMLRMDETDGGPQKYYTYFRKPSDVSRLTFMVHKVPDGNDQPGSTSLRSTSLSRFQPTTRTRRSWVLTSVMKMSPVVTGRKTLTA